MGCPNPVIRTSQRRDSNFIQSGVGTEARFELKVSEMKIASHVVNGSENIGLASHLNPVDVKPNGAPLAYTGKVIPSIDGNIIGSMDAVADFADFNAEAGLVVVACLSSTQAPLVFSQLGAGLPLSEISDVLPPQ